MIFNNLSRAWNRGIRTLLRPSELLSGVISSFRIAANPLSALATNSSTVFVPVAIGTGYQCIKISDAEISDTSDTEYRYTINGIPSGIIYFGKSAEGGGASLYYNYIEQDGVYYFKEDPRSFGIPDTRNGQQYTFLVFNPNNKTLGLQDVAHRYSGSCDYFVNCEIAKHDTTAGISNGVNHNLVVAAAGRSALYNLEEADIAVSWSEAGVGFALTQEGELLRGYPYSSTSDGAVYKQDEVWHYSEEPIPGVVAVDTTYGPDDEGAHRALQARINFTTGRILYQKFDVSQYLQAADATGLYVFYDNTKSVNILPRVEIGMHPYTAVLKNSGSFGVMRLSWPAGIGTVVSLNGEEFGSSLTCGKYIKAISFIRHAGNSFASDVILSHVQVKPKLVHAGGCVVFTR